MASQQVHLLSNIRGYVVGTKAAIEVTTGLGEGSLGYATDTDETGSYDGTSWTWGGSGGFPNPFALTADITPTALSADVDDYNPTGLSTADVLRLACDGNNRNITGLAGGADGRIIIIQNVGTAFNLTLVNASTSSAEANRFAIPSDAVIRPSKMAVLIYDATISRWKLFASSNADTLQGAGVAAGLGGSIQNNDLLIYNGGDTSLERITPADLATLMGVVGDSHDHVGGDGAALKYTDVIGAFLDGTAVPASTTYYGVPFKPLLNSTAHQIPWPEGGVLSDMTVRQGGAQPASGSLVVTLMVNGVATALVVTVPAGGSNGSYTNAVNTVTLSAADTLQWRYVNNATSATGACTAINMLLKKSTTA